MTQEEKSILLQDLSARLPYGVKIHLETSEYGELIGTLDAVYPTDDGVIVDNLDKAIAHINVRCGGFNIEEDECKPYLRPMSSMTRKELYEVQEILGKGIEIHDVFISIVDSSINTFSYLELQAVFDWLNAHHFDYRGLIEKGLALEAPKGMYSTK